MGKIQNYAKKFQLGIKKHAPEISIISGLVVGVVALVETYKAAKKAEPVIAEQKAKIQAVKDEVAEKPDPEKREAITKAYLDAGLKIGKEFIKPASAAVVSGGLIVSGMYYGKKSRNSLAAQASMLAGALNHFYNRVSEKYGVEEANRLRYNNDPVEVIETYVDEDGNEKTVTTEVMDRNNLEGSPYGFFFEEYNSGRGGKKYKNACYRSKDPQTNLVTVNQIQVWANDVYNATGILFLNEVRKQFGKEPTYEGQFVGWCKGADNCDDYVDFRVFDSDISRREEQLSDYINGYEDFIFIDPNCVYIVDALPRRDGSRQRDKD